jgi:hypothetical protein
MLRRTAFLALLLTACSTIERPESNPEPWDWGFSEYALDTAKLYGIQWVWTYATSEEFREGLRNFTWQGWWDNISQPPVWDDGSSDLTNNVWHPLAGAFTYGFMRARGYPFEAAASQTLLQSVLFEYTIEGIYTRPSSQDMLKTTVVGVTLGVIMDESARWLLKQESRTARVFGYILNPLYLFPGMHGKPSPVQVQVNFFQPAIMLTWHF